MRIVKSLLISILFFLVLGISACKDPAVEPENTITLKVEVKHHSILVPNAHIWLEKTDEFPGDNTDLYTLETISDQWAVGTFTELSKGTYWMYAEGFDGVDSVVGYNSILLMDTLLLDIVETELQVSE